MFCSWCCLKVQNYCNNVSGIPWWLPISLVCCDSHSDSLEGNAQLLTSLCCTAGSSSTASRYNHRIISVGRDLWRSRLVWSGLFWKHQGLTSWVLNFWGWKLHNLHRKPAVLLQGSLKKELQNLGCWDCNTSVIRGIRGVLEVNVKQHQNEITKRSKTSLRTP